jgi:hypothetical protein
MRIRYWRLTTEDLFQATYPLERANHWEIKCLQGEYEHFGIFWYKYGTPYDKEPIHGLAIYYNDIPKNKVDELIDSEEKSCAAKAECFSTVQRNSQILKK